MLLSNGGLTVAPQALAELSPLISSDSFWYPESTGLSLERRHAQYGEIYRSQPFVFSVIEKRAQAVARLPIRVWRQGDETRVLDKASGYAQLLSRPNARLDPFTFWMWVSATLDIYGETYLLMDDAKAPSTFYPLHPSRVAIKRDTSGVETYRFTAGPNSAAQSVLEFPAEQVVPFRRFTPNGTMRGMSKLEPLRSTIFAEDSGRTAAAAMLANGGRPNLVLSSDKELGKVGRQRLRDSWNETHQGSANAGKALVLEDGVSANPMQLSSVELQMIETRQLNREEICAVYDVAPPMIHLLERATFSNISAQMRAFYRDTMAPVLEFIESVLDHHVGDRFDGALRAAFVTEDVIRGDFEQRASSAQALSVIGAITPNEARELTGWSRFDDPIADKLYANSAQQELGRPALFERVNLTGQVENDPDGIAEPASQLAAPNHPETGQPAKTPVAEPPKAYPTRWHGGLEEIDGRLVQAKTPDYVHMFRSEIGRGNDIEAYGRRLIAKRPGDIELIYAALLQVRRAEEGQ